jgi:hypothetical protein
MSESTDGAHAASTIVTAEESRQPQFGFVGRELDHHFEALRDTFVGLRAAAKELDNPEHSSRAPLEIQRQMSDEDREALRSVFEGLPEDGFTLRQLSDELWEAFKDKPWGPDFTLHVMSGLTRTKRQPIFHNAMLISVVAAFEAHLARLATEYYVAAPEALHDVPKEAPKEFSLRDLQEMRTIADAIQVAIESRVSQLTFGSLATWRKFFSDRMNVDMSSLAIAWPAIQEIFERRHCVVHSEGRVSRRYANAIKGAEIGHHLAVDAKYVEAAIDALEVLGIQLLIAVWSKFSRDKGEIQAWLEGVAFRALIADRYQVSLALYSTWQNLDLPQISKHMAKVNIWLALKGLHGLDSIRADVEAWDVSGSDELFQFAKYCLLEDLDNSFALAATLVERDKLDGKSLAMWPLTEVMRRDSRIQKFKDIMQDFISEESSPQTESAEGDMSVAALFEEWSEEETAVAIFDPDQSNPDPDATGISSS